ncbi:unnamed protein product [Parnassius apollo]|uniref:(apollo) hypothetical protein n=1 Tax=Parnassius apollo TaxID=110799 RepID=A0A8S3WPP0_PARAO|nr:unnamed protein product [Parnassius apollo]
MAQKGTRIGPLPGGRWGASGAGAGRGSMRAASRARGAARSPSSPSHPSSPPEGLVSAGSSRTQQAAPAAGGARRMRWTKSMNENALRAYYRAKGEETVGIAYRSRCIAFLLSWSRLSPSRNKTWQTEFGTSCARKYLMMPNSNDYDVRLFRRRINRLWLEMQLHIRQTSIHTWKPPWIFQLWLIRTTMK